MSGIGGDVGHPLRGGSALDRINWHQLRDHKRKADGSKVINRYRNAPRNIIFPINPASPVALDEGHGYQAQKPDANLCYPLQWRMFHGLDSNWIIHGRDGVTTDNSAAVNNEKQWAFERSIALAKNYTAFNGQGYNGEIEGYPLEVSADLMDEEARPLTLAPRDMELLSTFDPATSTQYAFEHPRMSLWAHSQSQRSRKSKPKNHIDSRFSTKPSKPTPPSQEPRQAAAAQQQSEIDAQLHGEAHTLPDAFVNPNKGFHDRMGSKEKPPFPISPPLPVGYNPFAQVSPQWANERASFPMSPVPSADKLFHGRPTSVWQGRNLFEGLSTAAEPVRLESMERTEKGPFPMSPDLDGPRLTPSEPPTPSSIFGSPAAPLDAVAAARKQNEGWAQGPIPGLARPAPNSAAFSPSMPGSENDAAQALAVPAAPGLPSLFADRMDVTPDTTQDAALTVSDGEHESARFQAAAAPAAGASRAGAEDGDAPKEPTGTTATRLLESSINSNSEATADPVTTPKSSLPLGEPRVLMPTVPQTRRVADKALRGTRRKRSLAIRRRKPLY